MKILAVDDSPTMRRIIINTLKRAGYEDVVEASDGKDALAKVEIEKPNFIITDWNMPEMDGLTLVTTLRSKDEYKNLPILMVTTRSVKDDIMEAMKAGVNNYIVKPFTPETLKAKINQVLAG
ncbi:MAG: two-component system response regulator [Candidatus Zixiibacteriota bacterium]|nr:MAG: two-component system response regulator [candidate division Zixibacteria bacterium]